MGEALPDFSLRTADGVAMRTGALRGGPVVFHFRLTDGDASEAEPWARVAETGAAVLVVLQGSAFRSDSPFRELHAKHPGFLLIEDRGGDLAKRFGIAQADPYRATWIIDGDGIARATFQLHDAPLEALEVLDRLLDMREPSADAGMPARYVTADTAIQPDTRVFRYLRVGKVPVRSERLTWALSREPASARLEIRCQIGPGGVPQPGLVLDGRENDESVWQSPVVTKYEGPRVPGTEEAYELVADTGPVNDAACRELPPRFTLRCLPESPEVLPAGAEMSRASVSAQSLAGWTPNHGERPTGLRCEPTLRGIVWAPAGLTWAPRPPFFAAPTPERQREKTARSRSAGVEWAEEHSDSIQGAALRWMVEGPR